MTDNASEYGRLLAERDRLVATGIDPADLVMPLPPLDPDPLTVVGEAAGWADGFDEGYAAGVRDSFPPRVATLIVAVVMLVAGVLIGWAIGGGA